MGRWKIEITASLVTEVIFDDTKIPAEAQQQEAEAWADFMWSVTKTDADIRYPGAGRVSHKEIRPVTPGSAKQLD